MSDKEFVRFRDLDRWLVGSLPGRPALIKVSGAFTHDERPDHWLDLVEVDGVTGFTVRLLIPKDPPHTVGGKKRNPAAFCGGTPSDWGNGWAPVLVGSLLAPPRVDPVRLQDVLHDTRRIRVVCDTSALASGILSWLLAVLDGKVDAITSAVVDREIAGWADRHPAMWQANDVVMWARRTKYLLARRVLETAPDGVVIERLSPDQGALIASKVRDDAGDKAPDADMLMVELARRLIREQPPSARLLYLTGDRNHARSAASAIGSENVLFAAADGSESRRSLGSTVVRAWWRPGGPMGGLIMPPLSHLFWNLLAACPTIQIEVPGNSWEIRWLSASENGVPSDWQDPWLAIRGREPTSPARAATGTFNREAQQAAESTPVAFLATGPMLPGATAGEVGPGKTTKTPHVPDVTKFDSPRDASAESGRFLHDSSSMSNVAAPQAVLPNDIATEASAGRDHEAGTAAPVIDVWLLRPVRRGLLAAAVASHRPAPGAVFPILWKGISGTPPKEPIAVESAKEAIGILVALGALDADGHGGPAIDSFREMWSANDLDAFHAEFMRLPSYQAAVEALRSDPCLVPKTSRQAAQLTMARCLGQVARLEKTARETWVGDAPLSADELVGALIRWMPTAESAIGVADLCTRAARELRVTPARLERALIRLWRDRPDVPFEGQTGGQAVPGYAERVVDLSPAGYSFREVVPGGLTFGRRGPVRFIVRTR